MNKNIKSTLFLIKFKMKYNFSHICNLIVLRKYAKKAKYLIIYQSQNSW